MTERNTPSGSSNAGQDSTNLRIGAGHDGTYERWDGRVAEFAWWNRILTAGEAAILGKAYSPLFVPNGLVLYTPLVRATFDLKGGAGNSASGAVPISHPRIIYPTSFQDRRFTTASGAATSVKDLIMAGILPFAR